MPDQFTRSNRHGYRRAHGRTPSPRTKAFVVTAIAVLVLVGVAIALLISSTSTPRTSSTPVAASPIATETVPAIEPTPTPEPEPVEPPAPEPPLLFDAANALAETRDLESFGVRSGGSKAERDAALWIQTRMTALGYSASIEEFPLDNGAISRNVVARSAGTSPRVIVLGAHFDSKVPSPGANDNGTGVGALLELARILDSQPVTSTVEFVFFGTEETIDSNSNHHHYGSRFRVSQMSNADRANTAGMISVDMIGYGPDLHSRTMLRGPQDMSDMVLAQAKASGIQMTFLKDKGSSGWSDHEAYELARIPATWVEWRDDPVYHTAKDTSDHIVTEKVRVAGQLVLDVLRSLDETALEELCRR